MKNVIKFFFLMLLFLSWNNTTIAQPRRGLNQSELTKLYNTATEMTLEGKIIQAVVVDSGYGRFPGVIADVKTQDKQVKVYVAPAWYMDSEKIELKKDQSLTITGSRVTHNNQALLISRTIKHDGKDIKLRDSNGVPVWAGKAMGPGTGRGKARRRQ